METINLKNVSKTYHTKKKDFPALKNLSFATHPGEIIGLVGPNGAGKSTLVKLLCGILTPTEGSINVLNQVPYKNRKTLANELGVMFGNRSSLWFNIPAIESVYLMRDIYQIEASVFQKRLEHYGKILGVEKLLEKPVREMSLGQRIRVELLVSILHEPKILLLDEPTLGLDIVTKNHLRQLFVTLSEENQTTILLTTHDISDVEKICHRVLLINHGEKLLDCNRQDFKRIQEQQNVILVDPESCSPLLMDHPKLREKNPEWLKFILSKDEVGAFIQNYLTDAKFVVDTPDLEDILYDLYED